MSNTKRNHSSKWKTSKSLIWLSLGNWSSVSIHKMGRQINEQQRKFIFVLFDLIFFFLEVLFVGKHFDLEKCNKLSCFLSSLVCSHQSMIQSNSTDLDFAERQSLIYEKRKIEFNFILKRVDKMQFLRRIKIKLNKFTICQSIQFMV